MNSTIDEKIKQYENTAVEVANEMHNPNVRAENSKEVIENFPNVRLASEKDNFVKGGSKSLFSYFLAPTILAVGVTGSIVGYNAGYSKGNYQNEARKELDAIKQSYQRTINQIINERNDSVKGFMQLLDHDVFAEYYGKQIFGTQLDQYQKEFVKQRIEQELKEVKK